MVGPIIERGLLRFIYGRDEVVLVLVTYALFLILEDLVKLVWGVESYFVSEPYGLLGNVEVGDLSYPTYSAVLVIVAIVVGLALRFGIYGTRYGKLLLAVIHDREMSAALGIDVGRMYLVTFTLGTTLAAIGGALTAPTVSVVPGMGVEVIVLAFAVVVIGGLGSMPGAALGAVIVGLVRSAAVHLLPEVELFSIYLVMAARAGGAASRPVRRRGGEEDMTASRSTGLGLVAALVAALAAAPLLPSWAIFLVTLSLAKGLVVLGLLLLMRTGLVSFGQGLYYAIGAYAAGTGGGRPEAQGRGPDGAPRGPSRPRRWRRCSGCCSPATAPSSSPC